MNPKIVDVKPKEGYILEIKFNNDVIKNYDMSIWVKDSRFEALKNKALFTNVKVDIGGYGISWNDKIDLSEYELWTNGVLVN